MENISFSSILDHPRIVMINTIHTPIVSYINI